MLAAGMLFSEEISWIKDLDGALNTAKKENKIVMIDVFTEWCTWCKKLDEETYKDKKVIELSKEFINLKINPETDKKGSEFLTKFKIEGYPTILFIDSSANQFSRIGGFLAGEAFSAQMEKILNLHKNMNVYINEVKNGEYKNAKTLLDFYFDNDKINDAASLYEQVKDKKILTGDETAEYNVRSGLYYGNTNEIKKAKTFFQNVYANYKETKIFFEAGYYLALTENLDNNKDEAKKIINDLLQNKNTSETWKKYYNELLTKLK